MKHFTKNNGDRCTFRNAFAFAFAFFFSFALQAQTPPAPAPDNIDYGNSKTILQWKNNGWQPERVGRTQLNSDRTACLGDAINPVYISATYPISTAELTAGAFPAGVTGVLAGSIYTISGTPTASGTFNYTVTVTGAAGKSGSVSGKITVKADCPPPTLPEAPDDYYCLGGSICFDIAQTEGGEACGDLLGRTPDFSETARTYTLSGTATEIKFYVLNDEKNLVKSLTQDGSNTVTVNFADDVNGIVSGEKETFTLVVQFKDNTDTPVQKSLTVKVQDCNCGCILKSGTCSWIAFMCYNLGANPNMSIADQVAYTSLRYTGGGASTARATDALNVHGDLYQWGRKADGHEKRSSQSYFTNGTTIQSSPVLDTALDANGQVQGPPDYPAHAAYGKFIKHDSGNADWRVTQLNTLWDGNEGLGTTRIKTANDPCPQGWRVPTLAEWAAVADLDLNDRTVTGTWGDNGSAAGTPGRLFKPRNGDATVVTTSNATLFLPAAGWRNCSTSAFEYVGIFGHYWSSTIGSMGAFPFGINEGGVSVAGISYRAFGFSVRCVAE